MTWTDRLNDEQQHHVVMVYEHGHEGPPTVYVDGAEVSP